MAKTALRAAHLLLDLGTWARLRDIASWSEEVMALSKTIRAVIRKFHALLAQQVAVEAKQHVLYLVEVGADGAEAQRERLNLKL